MPEVSFDISAAGWLESSSTTYSTARAGTGTLTVGSGDSIIGQQLSAGTYRIREAFYAFNTSTIPVGSTISAARLEATNWGDNSTTDFTINARPYAATRGPWGPTLATSDWIAGANLATYTDAAKGATQATSSLPALYTGFTFTDANLIGAVVMGGTTELVVYSSRTSGNNTPTGDEFVTIATGGIRPHLVVTYTAGTAPAGPGLEIQFRSRGWSGSADTFGTWRTITCQAMGAGWTRGNSEHRGLLNFPEATQANAQLWDPDRILDPANTSSPYYGQIDVGADIQFLFGGRQVFLGRITTLDHVLQVHGDASVAVASIDALSYQGKMGLVKLADIVYPLGTFPDDTDTTYDRINLILDYCQIPTGPAYRDIEAGGVTHWDFNPDPGEDNAWDWVVMTMRSEIGSLEVMPSGVIRTRNRNTVWPSSPPAPTLQLGCHAGAIPVYSAEFATVRDTVRNSVQATWRTINEDEGAVPQEDATSKAKYGMRSFSEDLTLTPDTGPDGTGSSAPHEAWKSFFLARMKNPMRQWIVETRPATQAQVDAIESVPLYTGRARLTIDSHGPAIDVNVRVIGMEWTVTPDSQVCRLVLGDEAAVPVAPTEVTKYRTAIMGTAGLHSYWRLGDPTNIGDALDEKGYNGVYAGSPRPTVNQPGAVSDTDKSALFVSGGYVTVGTAGAFLFGDVFSLEAWIKPSGSGLRGIVGRGPGGWYLRVNASGYLELVRSNIQIIATSTVTVSGGSWSHVVATKNVSTVKIYINAVDRTGAVNNDAIPDTFTPVTIGAESSPAGGGARYEFYSGGIDEVAVYSVALSAATVSAHYAARI